MLSTINHLAIWYLYEDLKLHEHAHPPDSQDPTHLFAINIAIERGVQPLRPTLLKKNLILRSVFEFSDVSQSIHKDHFWQSMM